jgi:glucuronokinase
MSTSVPSCVPRPRRSFAKVPEPARGVAPARAALAGNPSDGYGGAVLAVTIEQLTAEGVVLPTRSGGGAAGDAGRLVDATRRRFQADVHPGSEPPPLRVSTTIPRSVGLGGSSALVIAVLRALCEHCAVVLEPAAMAELALSIEVDDLGIAAGLQDRVAQCHGGVTFMEFGCSPPRYESFDRGLLPPLVVAWREDGAAHSGGVHGDLRERYGAGDAVVGRSMAELGELARAARAALLSGDGAALAGCADASFAARARMMDLDPRHVEMVHIARGAGAGVNYTGSGGAIVCVCAPPCDPFAVERALRAAGCGVVVV